MSHILSTIALRYQPHTAFDIYNIMKAEARGLKGGRNEELCFQSFIFARGKEF